ncbi:MAG: DUF4956 domain-containing protein [Ignavibacteriales bacterium]
MIQDLSNILQVNLSPYEIIQNFIVALVCGLILSFFYKKSYAGPGYLKSFVNSLIILTLITALVIMIIGNNLARAFGLVGAMSIIRFRTAVKDTNDIVYIFFSLAVGMAAGVGLHGLAFIGTMFIGLTSLALTKIFISSKGNRDFLLQFNFRSTGNDESVLESVFNKYLKKVKLINIKSIGENNISEYSYYVNFKSHSNTSEFINELRRIDGMMQVNVFFDEEYF